MMIADMIAEGATPEMILVAVRAVERQEDDALERRREADRVRQERHRTKSRDKTLGNVRHGLSRSHAGVEDTNSTQGIEPQVKNNGRSDLEGFRAELSPDLDPEHLEALLKHRRLKKSQITAHAAKLFRRDAGLCGLSLAEAVETCMSRNWITVKAEWLTERRQQGPPTRAPTAQELLKARRQEIKDDERPPDRPMLVASR
jgi:hypothetical protein